MGIEPTFLAWEANVLPLNYTRRGKYYASEIRHQAQYRGFYANIFSWRQFGVKL